jgi:hypothetical protein
VAVEKRNISRVVSERITNKRKILRRSGEGVKADVYLEVRKRRGHIFLNETSACGFATYKWNVHKAKFKSSPLP